VYSFIHLSNGGITNFHRRRAFFIQLGAALLAPRAVIAQTIRYIGILGDTPGPQWDVFRNALAELGYFESGYPDGPETWRRR
jgi:hypothetical protein